VTSKVSRPPAVYVSSNHPRLYIVLILSDNCRLSLPAVRVAGRLSGLVR
jgi:hypothetical protein